MLYAGTIDSTDPADFTQIGGALTAQSEQIRTNVGVQGRYVMVYSTTGEVISLAEVQVFGEEAEEEEPPVVDNLALNQPAIQSSIGFGGAASRAVDGNTNGDYFGGNSVTHTAPNNATAWWRVDLGAVYDLTEVRIFNRTDSSPERLSGAMVYAGTQESTDPADYTQIGGALTAQSEQIRTNVGVQGRYVMVYSTTGQVISLAEVQVFGEEAEEVPPNNEPVATLYTNRFFQANSAALVVGDYPNISLEGIPLNDVTSVQVAAGFRVELYPELNFGGTPFVLTADADDLVALGFDDDTESVRVFANEPVATLYTNRFFQANSAALVVGDYPNISLEGIPLNDVTSVQVAAGFRVELYPELNFGGTPFVLTADADDLVALGFDDDTESVRVFANGTGATDDCECASGQRSLLVNGSFEDTSNPNYDSAFDLIEALGFNFSGVKFIDRHPDTDFPGWFTTGGIFNPDSGVTSVGGTLELGQSGFLGAEAPDGRVFAEMDGNHHNQLVSVTPGQILDWELSLRGRVGVDVIDISAGAVDNQTVVATVSAPAGQWTRHTGQFQVPNGVTQLLFTITPTEASNGDIDSSHLLDFVKLCPSNGNTPVTTFTSSVGPLMTVSPNPVNDMLHINSDTPMQQSALIQIYSSFGTLVVQDKITFDNGIQASTYVGGLNTGIYTVVILNPDTGQSSTVRILKE